MSVLQKWFAILSFFILLEVKDSGIGMPEDIELQNTQTFGLRLVTDLARQLKGTFQFTLGYGTDIEILFPPG
jgi:two-component system, sensor histidine kinase PdtaS